VFTDPSYLGQLVVMTAPMIGNYGVNHFDLESASGKPQVSGVIVREMTRTPSNWRSEGALDHWLERAGIPAIEEIDTRRLARHIRAEGAMKGVVALGASPTSEVQAILDASPSMQGLDLASKATCVGESIVGPTGETLHRIVAFDFGMKQNIVRIFSELGCEVTVVPSTTSVERVLELAPDGVFLSNGPGDPAAVDYVIPVIRTLAERGLPTFGICLGHQLLALAFGAETMKLPYGHRGGNQPVRDVETERVLITSQNHGFAVQGTTKGVPGAKSLEVTHLNLNDSTVEGVRHLDLPAFGVQYHPEASPGPHDARNHFRQFLQTLDRQ